MFGSGGEVPEEEAEAEEEADGEAVAEGHALARAGSANLREHVVSLLFSGDSEKLPPLQKQVCSLIFSELQQEAAGMAAAPGALDDFTFELCSLVLALSGTRAGVRHIASLPSILTTICTLLTVGTPRLQRQAIVILKRTVLQTMSPDAADKMLRARMQYVRAEGFCGFLMALAASGFSGSVQLRVPGAPMTTVKMDGAGLDARVSWDIALELIELIGQLDGEGWADASTPVAGVSRQCFPLNSTASGPSNDGAEL